MIKYIIKRLLQLIPILVGITFLSFAMMRWQEGMQSPTCMTMQGRQCPKSLSSRQKRSMGWTSPFWYSTAPGLAGMLTGDMGESYVSHRDVQETFVSKLPATLLLTVSSMAVTILLAVPLGILSAVKQNRLTDMIIRFFQLYRKFYAEFFRCIGIDVLFFN